MTNPLYHVRTYYSCSVQIRNDLDRMSKITGLSKSEIIRIAVDQLLTKWEKKREVIEDEQTRKRYT